MAVKASVQLREPTLLGYMRKKSPYTAVAKAMRIAISVNVNVIGGLTIRMLYIGHIVASKNPVSNSLETFLKSFTPSLLHRTSFR